MSLSLYIYIYTHTYYTKDLGEPWWRVSGFLPPGCPE